jgi:FAD/FMN-containing dehydrogenase
MIIVVVESEDEVIRLLAACPQRKRPLTFRGRYCCSSAETIS